MKVAWIRWVSVASLAAALMLGGAVSADSDHERARRLTEQGEILSLAEVLERAQIDGRILEVELDDEDDRLVYELEFVDSQGVVWELALDAATGRVLERQRED